jgi:nucleotide-binding universal stress UspA family protein
MAEPWQRQQTSADHPPVDLRKDDPNPPLSDHQNGNRTADKDLRGLAAEQKTAKPASAVGGHDDKIAMSLLGGRDDCLGGLSLGDMNSFGVDAKPIRSSFDISQNRRGRFLLSRLVLRHFRRSRYPVGTRIDWPALCRHDDGDLGANALGQRHPMINPLPGNLRSVCRYEDVRVHDRLVCLDRLRPEDRASWITLVAAPEWKLSAKLRLEQGPEPKTLPEPCLRPLESHAAEPFSGRLSISCYDAVVRLCISICTPRRLFSALYRGLVNDKAAYEADARTHALSETRAFSSRHLGIAADNLDIQVGFGDAAPCIAAYAAQTEVDLVFAGTHGRTGLFRVLLGSVASALLCEVACDVIIVPSKGTRRPARDATTGSASV